MSTTNEINQQLLNEHDTTGGIPAKRVKNYVWNSSTLEWERQTNSSSSASGGKATDAYAISNIEDTGTYKYFGFEDADGAWYIMRKTLADNTFLYAKGASNYSTAWTNRASQTYASYATTF